VYAWLAVLTEQYGEHLLLLLGREVHDLLGEQVPRQSVVALEPIAQV
jgi:hypothetical protein